MKVPVKSLIRLLARLLVTTALLVWVFRRVDLTQFGQTVKTARWHYLLAVWLFTLVFFWIQSIVMKLILRRQECPVGLNILFGTSCITALYSMILPGILSTGVKWYILARHTGKGSHVLSGMLYNQLMLLVAMAVIGLIGLIVTNPTGVLLPNVTHAWVLPVVCGLLLAWILSTVAALLHPRTGGPVTRALASVLARCPARGRDKGNRLLAQIAVFQTAGLQFHLTVVALNVVDGLFIGLLIYLSAARAAYVDAPMTVLIWLCAIVFILGKLPISVANLGVREATLVGLLAGYGVTESAALLMSMILFSSLIFMAAIGVVYQVCWLRGTRKAAVRRTGPP